jgi:hypothetical protein
MIRSQQNQTEFILRLSSIHCGIINCAPTSSTYLEQQYDNNGGNYMLFLQAAHAVVGLLWRAKRRHVSQRKSSVQLRRAPVCAPLLAVASADDERLQVVAPQAAVGEGARLGDKEGGANLLRAWARNDHGERAQNGKRSLQEQGKVVAYKYARGDDPLPNSTLDAVVENWCDHRASFGQSGRVIAPRVKNFFFFPCFFLLDAYLRR